MKKTLILLFGFCLQSCSTQTSFDQTKIREQITAEETRSILFTLAHDDMKGRDTKSGGYYKAANYVTDYFKTHAIQPFYPAYRDSLMTDSIGSFNLVGQIGHYDAKRPTVLIGAHLDHIGMQDNEEDQIFNGANDNAAGSTAVLQIARFLAQHTWNQNILIALFADEEKGLKGAYHLAERLQNEQINLAYMVNFEMIGTTLTTGENQVYMTGYKRSNMADEMNAISADFVQFLPQAKQYNLFKRSDNYAFYQAFGVPAQTLSSFDFQNYDFYHKAGDEAEKLDVKNMNQIIGTAAYTLAILLQNERIIKMTPQE
jgi:Zn-dependent M28 family amino/carboxypeptidase